MAESHQAGADELSQELYAYIKKRQRNNELSKECRERKKIREIQNMKRMEELEAENKQLKDINKELHKQLTYVESLLRPK